MRGKSNMRKLFVIVIVVGLVPSVFAQGTDSAVQKAVVPLSSAQLQHLKTNPVQVVAPAGTGKLLNLVSLVAQYKAGSSPYALGDGGDFTASLGSAALGIRLIAAGFIDRTANQIQFNSPSGLGTQSDMENQPLTISNNGAGEWTDGDGSVIVIVYYTVVDLQ